MIFAFKNHKNGVFKAKIVIVTLYRHPIECHVLLNFKRGSIECAYSRVRKTFNDFYGSTEPKRFKTTALSSECKAANILVPFVLRT